MAVAWGLQAATLEVDAGRKTGQIRPIHGINGGPICYGGVVDLSPYHKALGIPMTRIHDANWPARDVVDVHAIFPDFDADPDSPAAYHFAPTDDYLKSILATGSRVMYRLGESIEHTPHKYYVHKPADYDRWARICLGIIRHYNEGWADGCRLDLRYFEIWNESEIGPAQWDATAGDYYRLYATAARAIKARWPALKVGGPAAAGLGRLDGCKLTPAPYLRGFLEYCRKESVPLDFLSWHMYTADPTAPVRGTRGLRAVLDELGLQKTESHLDEWNYLPGNDWGPMLSRDGRRLQKWFDDAGGVRGAAFVACVLLGLQDAPLDMGNFYTGDNGAWGLFNHFGVPKKTYYAFLGFKALVDHPLRVAVQGGKPGELAAVAGLSADSGALLLLVSNFNSADRLIEVSLANLPWQGASQCELLMLDDRHDLERVRMLPAEGSKLQIVQDLPAPGVFLIRVRRAGK
jgi:hypothetical protein